MRQAGAEAAAKAGQKKTSSVSAIKAQAEKEGDATKKKVSAPTTLVGGTTASKIETDAAEPAAENTSAKTPGQLAAEGATKTISTDKLSTSPSEAESKSGPNPCSIW